MEQSHSVTPPRSEESVAMGTEILRFAQDDKTGSGVHAEHYKKRHAPKAHRSE